MADRSIIDAFNDCLDRIQAGQPVEDVLRQYPTYADTLRPMLEITRGVQRVRVSPAEIAESQNRVRADVLQAYRDRATPTRRIYAFPRVLSLAAALLLACLCMIGSGAGLVATGIIDLDNDVHVATPSALPTLTNSPSPTLSVTPSPSATATVSPSSSPSSTPTSSATVSATSSASRTPTASPTPTVTNSHTATPTPSQTASRTRTPSPTATRTATRTNTPAPATQRPTNPPAPPTLQNPVPTDDHGGGNHNDNDNSNDNSDSGSNSNDNSGGGSDDGGGHDD